MTADCRLTERLFGFADETLRPTPAVLARASEHLVVCAPCAERFCADARLARALRDVPPCVQEPPPLAAPPSRRVLWPFAIAAAAALLAVAVPLVLDRRAAGPPAPADTFSLPPGTTFTLTVSTITLDRGRRSVVEETTRYAADSGVSSRRPLEANHP
jgi:hypothetical protein